MRSEEIAIYIGDIVGKFPIEVSNLLRKNSIVNSQYVPNNISKLVENTFFGLQNSKNFKSDFANLMIEKGNNDSSLNKPLFLNNDGLGTGTSSGSNTLGYVNAGVNLLSSGFNFFGKDKDRKVAEANAKAQIESNKLLLEAKKLELQGKKLDADTALALAKTPQSKSNTGLYIGLGIGGAVILGLVVYLAVKK
jgi:hypothetical protein